MLNKIKSDIKNAMLNHDNLRKDTLRMVVSNAQLLAKEAKREVTNDDVLNALNREIKQTKQAISVCEQNGDTKSEFHNKNKARLSILEEYLPKQLTPDEIKAEIRSLIKDIDKTNKGIIMKTVMPALKGKADGKLVNQLVQEVLSE